MKRTDKTRLRVFLMLLAYVFLLCLLIFFIKFRSRNKKIIFGSTYMTMNNPYFNVLNENLRDTIEANGDILITRDPAQSQSRQNAQIIDMLNEGIDILFANAGAIAAYTLSPDCIALIVWKICDLSEIAPKGQFTRHCPQDTHLS